MARLILFMAIFAILNCWVIFSKQEPVTHYNNYTVYRLRPENEAQFKFLHGLEEEIDFWRDPDTINRIADVMLSPSQKTKILSLFKQTGIGYEVLVQDVEKLIEAERHELGSARSGPSTFDTEAIPGFWNTYQRLGQHQALVDALVEQNPSLAARFEIGTSYEGRTIVGVRIGANSNAQKPVIFIEGGIHAREWISPATVSFFAQQLLNKYSDGDSDVTAILSYFDIYIIPVLNVDGYEYSHTTTRLWRKTRRPSSSSTCIGADPNRNFGYQWGGSGASTNPCSETYRGDAAFSEPEVKAETDYILANFQGRIKSFIAVHSYGQYFMYPWGYTTALPTDSTELNRVARLTITALNAVSPSIAYTIGSSTNVLYAAAGGSVDWAYGTAGAKYSYTIELRDTGTYGFQLPAVQLVPTATETTAALIAMAKELTQV